MTDIIQAKETAPLGYHYTNAGILPNEWTSRPLSSIVEEIAETAGTRKIGNSQHIRWRRFCESS